MSDHKTVITRIFEEIINQRRLDLIDELFAEDYIDHGPTGELRGPDELRVMISAWLSAFPDVVCTVSHVLEEGDLAAWVVHTTGTRTGDGLGLPPTGRRIDTVSANIGRTRDGQAVEHWSEQGMLAVLQQIGVVPELGPPQGAGVS